MTVWTQQYSIQKYRRTNGIFAPPLLFWSALARHLEGVETAKDLLPKTNGPFTKYGVSSRDQYNTDPCSPRADSLCRIVDHLSHFRETHPAIVALR